MEDEPDDTKSRDRRSRNLSEKKRRDQFNELVCELGSIVSTGSRKMDKSTVLKATIAYLKNHNDTTIRSRAHDIQEEWKPAYLSNEEFTHLLLEALDGFIMVFSATGHIHFVTESVTSLLGHLPADILNQTIFDLAYDEDRPSLYSLLQNPGTSVDSMQAVVLKENQIKFQCHIRRGTLDFREEPTYELVQFIGYFRSDSEPLEFEGIPNFSMSHDSRFLFVCTGHLLLPQLIRDMPPAESEHREFISQLSLGWKYLFLDHRASHIVGYMPFEMLGTSGYDYYHLDDVDKVAGYHATLMKKGELTSGYYRFLTKGQQWIWLQTRFYISYHQWNAKPEFVICTHHVVSYADVVARVKCEQSAATLEDAATERAATASLSRSSDGSEDGGRRQMSQDNSQRSMSIVSAAGSCPELDPPDALPSTSSMIGIAHTSGNMIIPGCSNTPSARSNMMVACCSDMMSPPGASRSINMIAGCRGNMSPSSSSSMMGASTSSIVGAGCSTDMMRTSPNSNMGAAYSGIMMGAGCSSNSIGPDYSNNAMGASCSGNGGNAMGGGYRGNVMVAGSMMASCSSAPSLGIPDFIPYEGSMPMPTSQARSRYSSSDGSAPSVDVRLRRHRAPEERPPEPQSAMGSRYLEPAPYVVPVVITPVQVQLQRYTMLQQLIVTKEEEKRRVGEQLLKAGISLPPAPNMQYAESMSVPPPIIYEAPLIAQFPIAVPPMQPMPPNVVLAAPYYPEPQLQRPPSQRQQGNRTPRNRPHMPQ